jgi:hypothetical protein
MSYPPPPPLPPPLPHPPLQYCRVGTLQYCRAGNGVGQSLVRIT